jgi:indole-3-glycerol phosphate synthase
MSSYLDEILASHRARAAKDGRDLEAIAQLAQAHLDAQLASTQLREAKGVSAALRPFSESLLRAGSPAIIAEVKRRSPSKGALDLDLDPASVAADYERGGAACLSVLTDGPHFGGSPEDLAAARSATALPVLRKDFTVCAADVYDARIMGADAVACRLKLDALVEVHDLDEAERALGAGAQLIGVNQRDLRTFEVDSARAVRVAACLPPGIVKVAESGIRSRDDVARLGDAGYDAVLVGELLVRSGDRVESVRALRAPVDEVLA